MHNDDDRPVPRGLLFILDESPPAESRPDELHFEKMIHDLEAKGLCAVPKIKWVN